MLLFLIIMWFFLGGSRELWVWGNEHRRCLKRLRETEQRLRIMEALAMRGTDMADRLLPRDHDDELD